MTPRTGANDLQPPFAEPKKHLVRLHRDHTMNYPELWLNVFIGGDTFDEADFGEMFARAKCWKARTPESADLVIFTGGVDVDPALYGETAHETTKFDTDRDNRDIELYLKCRELGIPMLGVCRGAQFGHVMHDGKLYQDVDGHHGNHPIWDIKHKKMIEPISSVHHQMVRENIRNGMEIIATCARSTTRVLNATEFETGEKPDIEAFFYRDDHFLGVQGHPEYSGYPYYTNWVLELIEELITHSTDTRYEDQRLRIHSDIRAQRDAAEKASITKGKMK